MISNRDAQRYSGQDIDHQSQRLIRSFQSGRIGFRLAPQPGVATAIGYKPGPRYHYWLTEIH